MVDLTRMTGGMEPEMVSEPYSPVCLYLRDEEVRKLGLSDAKAGEEYNLVARVTIKEKEERMGGDKKISLSVELGFMEAEIKKAPAKKSAADKLYDEE